MSEKKFISDYFGESVANLFTFSSEEVYDIPDVGELRDIDFINAVITHCSLNGKLDTAKRISDYLAVKIAAGKI